MNNSELAFLVSLISMFIYFWSLTIRDKQKLLTGQILYTFGTGLNYLLISNFTMAALQTFGAIRIYSAKKMERNGYIFFFFVLSGFIVTYLTFIDYRSIIGFVGFMSFTVAGFYFDKIPMRLLFIVGNLSMFAVSFISESYLITAAEACAIFLNLLAIKKEITIG